MFKCKCPDAKLSNNTLALSLPDAITPAVWVMDMANEGTFIIKVEQNEAGYYVLQKISTKGKTEDIAFYNKKSKAIRAMSVITQAIDTNKPSKFSLFSVMKIFMLGVIALTILGLGYILYKPAMSIATSFLNGLSTTQILGKSSTPPVIEQTNTDAVGVPMSADDFLNNSKNRQPF